MRLVLLHLRSIGHAGGFRAWGPISGLLRRAGVRPGSLAPVSDSTLCILFALLCCRTAYIRAKEASQMLH